MQDFNFDRAAESGFPNGLMGSARAVAMDVVMRLAGAIARGRTETTISVDSTIANMDGIAIAPGFKIGMIGLNEPVDVPLTLGRDVLLELETAETGPSTFAEQLDLGGLVHP